LVKTVGIDVRSVDFTVVVGLGVTVDVVVEGVVVVFVVVVIFVVVVGVVVRRVVLCFGVVARPPPFKNRANCA
jgi:hypothetical protein